MMAAATAAVARAHEMADAKTSHRTAGASSWTDVRLAAMPPIGHATSARSVLTDLLIRALSFTLYVDKIEDDFVQGHTWPKHAVSMGGVDAMWNVADLLEKVLSDRVAGDFVETGVWKGANGILARKLLDAANDQTRTVWCMDSFAWLPPPSAKYAGDKGDKHHTFAILNPVLRADLPAVEGIYRRFGIDVNDPSQRTKLVKGFFNETAPVVARQLSAVAILRLDGDMYQSTWEVLIAMYEKVSVGGFVIVDDYGLPGAKQATDDFRECASIDAPLTFFLPEGSPYPGGRQGKAYWVKTAPVSADVRARPCYALKRRR